MRYDAFIEEILMPALQIRDLPTDVYEALSTRAEQGGRSLTQQALHELRRLPEIEAMDRSRATLRRIMARMKEKGSRRLDPAPEDLIREDRDR
jgi:plasmid stability protein